MTYRRVQQHFEAMRQLFAFEDEAWNRSAAALRPLRHSGQRHGVRHAIARSVDRRIITDLFAIKREFAQCDANARAEKRYRADETLNNILDVVEAAHVFALVQHDADEFGARLVKQLFGNDDKRRRKS